MKTNGHKIRVGKLSEFRPQASNANLHTERGLRMLDDSMSEDGYVAPMTAAADGEVIDGSARLERAYDKFDDDAIIVEHDGTRPIIAVRTDIKNANTKQAKRIALRANRIAQADLEWSPEVLAGLKDEGLTDGLFTEKELAGLLDETFEGDTIDQSAAKITLADRFLVPPFSVLDARQGYWQDRKRAWLALDIQSELGRGGGQSGTSARAEPGERPTYRQISGGGGGQIKGHNQHNGVGEEERIDRSRARLALSPGGSPRPAMKLRNGKTVRGDGRGREI